MHTSVCGGLGQNLPQHKFDLETAAGGPETVRTRIQRLAFLNKRCLLFTAYACFLCVVLAMAGFRYTERRDVHGIQLPLSFPFNESAAFDATQPLPRHPHYIIFELPSSPPELLADRPLRASPRLPEHCLESHITLGYPCFDSKPTPFDIVWTWVNGSDPRLQEAMKESAATVGPDIGKVGKSFVPSTSSPNSKLYRDHDELRHSFRSVLQHFRPHTKQFHLLMSDFPFSVDGDTQPGSPVKGVLIRDKRSAARAEGGTDEDNIEDGLPLELPPPATRRTLRLGQLPSWLSTEEKDLWSDGDVRIKVAYQAQVFQKYTGTSFNSYSIESQLPYLPDVGQHLIYLNDDFFFTGDLQPSDFYTSAYGVVLRLDPTLLVPPVPANTRASPAGEWGPLGYSSWLLGERFGSRPRPYPIHAAKSFSMPLLDEVAHIWDDEFQITSTHKFRGMRAPETGAGDAYMSFLLTHMIVERWREALLWSWVVGRVGGNEDQWGVEEQRAAWEQLGGDSEDIGRRVEVKMTQRKTVDDDKVSATLAASGQAFSKKTAYTFSSADGYPYSYANRRGQMAWPRFSGDNVGQTLCNIDFDQCIGAASTASEAFKTIAFERPVACGDCIIAALRSSSGVMGLSAFLPPRSRKFESSVPPSFWGHLLEFDVWGGGEDVDDHQDNEAEQDPPPIPHLPLVKNWKQGNFSLQAVLDPYGNVNVRAWMLRLMERYRFVLGDTNVVFLMIDGPNAARSGLKRVTKDVALLCMNDDVKDRHQMTDLILRDWQKRRWKTPAKWER